MTSDCSLESSSRSGKRRRSRDKHNSTNSTERDRSRKHDSRITKKKRRRSKSARRRGHDSSECSDSSSSSDDSSYERRRRRRRKQRKDRKEKKGKKRAKSQKEASSTTATTSLPLKQKADEIGNAFETPTQPEGNEEKAQKARTMAPISREQYEAEQAKVREVYDEESGRYRLVRGSGEIIERIVSRGEHSRINQAATRGDGASFARHIFNASRR